MYGKFSMRFGTAICVITGGMGMLPPYATLLRLRIEERGDRVLFVMPFHDDVLGRPGFLHGGAIAGLLEFAAFGALRRALDDEPVRMKPVNVTVDFLRGGTERDTLAAGVMRRLGKRVANVEASAWQEDEAKPIAIARMNVLLGRR